MLALKLQLFLWYICSLKHRNIHGGGDVSFEVAKMGLKIHCIAKRIEGRLAAGPINQIQTSVSEILNVGPAAVGVTSVWFIFGTSVQKLC